MTASSADKQLEDDVFLISPKKEKSGMMVRSYVAPHCSTENSRMKFFDGDLTTYGGESILSTGSLDSSLRDV